MVYFLLLGQGIRTNRTLPFLFLFSSSVLELGPGTSCTLGKHSTPDKITNPNGKWDLRAIVVSFLISVTKYLTRSNLREEGVRFGLQFEGTQFFMVGASKELGAEAR